MTGKDLFRIWAPAGKKWTDWVRPVPFVGMSEYSKAYGMMNYSVPPIGFIDENCVRAAIIVDLPGAQSVEMGIALAKAGYRPIPIYNGTIEQAGARATVDNQSVGPALLWGATELRKIAISDDALPAFLTDSNRMNRYKMEVSLFDNSWDVYHQDLPSADYFLSNGISKIVIVGNTFSKDLKKILYGFQKKNIEIFLTDGYVAPKKVSIRRPLRDDKF